MSSTLKLLLRTIAVASGAHQPLRSWPAHRPARAAFLALEASEFAGWCHGAAPQRSAFLSAFFTLVGCHGLHVTAGLLWLVSMMAQVTTKGFRPIVRAAAVCFSLFWHALDIIWVGLFTIVYLMEAAP